MLDHIINVITIIVALLPIGVKVFNLIAAMTHSKRLKNLSDRANIIVAGLEREDITNESKRDAAMSKLANYAKEVNIKVTGDQLEDYIESAVTFLKVLSQQK